VDEIGWAHPQVRRSTRFPLGGLKVAKVFIVHFGENSRRFHISDISETVMVHN